MVQLSITRKKKVCGERFRVQKELFKVYVPAFEERTHPNVVSPNCPELETKLGVALRAPKSDELQKVARRGRNDRRSRAHVRGGHLDASRSDLISGVGQEHELHFYFFFKRSKKK
jgi:hypothetical protein